MSRTPFHTVPNQVTVQLVEMAGRHVKHCVIVRRDGKSLAYYPAEWNDGRIPSMLTVQRDARWRKAE